MKPLSGDGDTGSTARKRLSRVQLSCDPCRLGKLKCDKSLPCCDQCYKRSRESACKYTERGLRYNTAHAKSLAMRDKLDRLEDFVSQVKSVYASGDAESKHVPQNGVKKTNGHSAVADPDLIPLAGKLNISETGTRYVGGAHWESIIDDIADVKAYFDQESSSPNWIEPTDEGTSVPTPDDSPSNPALGISQTLFTKQDLLRFLPQKMEMDRLVATWFNVYDPIHLIVHAPTFQKQYQVFWQDPDQVSVAWLSLLFSVGSAGAQVSGQARRDVGTLALAEDLRRLTVHALVLANSVIPQPFVIEALIFYEKSLILKSHDWLAQAWQVHGQVMRLLWHGGYHRDSGNNPNISPFECEMRRRVWMIAVEYDVLCSYQVGLVSIMNQKVCDTKPPSNLLDTDFSPSELPQPRAWEDYTLTLAGICYGKVVAIFGDIILASHTIEPPTRSEIGTLHEHLLRAREELPENLRILPMDQCFTEPPAQILDRYRIEILHQKALCVLYRRFLDQRGYEKEHKLCLQAAEALIAENLPLLEAAQPGGQLATCLVFIYRHIHDFNLAAMLLCSEIKRLQSMDGTVGGGESAFGRSNGSDSEGGRFISRVRPMLLQLCSLWISSGVVSPKARNAVRAIEKFLIRAPLLKKTEVTMTTAPAIASLTAMNGYGTADVLAVQQQNGGAVSPLEQTRLSSNYNLDRGLSLDPMTVGTFEFEHDPLFNEIFGAEAIDAGQRYWP